MHWLWRFLPKLFIQDTGVTPRPLELSCHGDYCASEVFTTVYSEKLSQEITFTFLHDNWITACLNMIITEQ